MIRTLKMKNENDDSDSESAVEINGGETVVQLNKDSNSENDGGECSNKIFKTAKKIIE